MAAGIVVTLVAGAVVVLLVSARGVEAGDGVPLTRRACLRLVIWGATGLSMLPGCRKRRALAPTCYDVAEAQGLPPADSLLGRWARLGEVWREMSRHARERQEPIEGGREAFSRLRDEMNEALEALPAWPELAAVFDQRWQHINRMQYVMATCYKMVPGGMPAARGVVEQKVRELEGLAGEGKLSREAARKAAGVLAVQAEYMARYRAAQDLEDDGERAEAQAEATGAYDRGRLPAGEAADLAGQRLIELTVDDMGYLAGPPHEGEGLIEATCYDMAFSEDVEPRGR